LKNYNEKEDNHMKRILGWAVVCFLILFIAAPLACTESKSFMDKIETGFQQEGYPFGKPPVMPGNVEQLMPCDTGHRRGMLGQKYHYFIDFRSLNLDEKQNDALKEIENDTAKELIRKKADMLIAQIELQELLEKDTVDLKAVEKKIIQIEALKTEAQLIVIKSIQIMKTKLTPDQLKILKKIRAMGHPGMRPPMMGEMMCDETKMPPPSAMEQGE
jgi:Spy/CpxP family protein refolding chaperone